MTTNIFLVRHGQTRSNTTGYYMGWSEEDLDETGYAQVRSLASRLAKLSITTVYTSPLKRTYSTAQIIAGPHSLNPKTVESVIELNIGDWQGLHMDEIKRRWPELWQQSRIDPSDVTLPNGESFGQLTERVVRAYAQILEKDGGKQVVVVSHDAIIRVLVAHVLGVTNNIYRRMIVDNASLSTIRVTDGHARVVLLNDTAHLEAKNRECV